MGTVSDKSNDVGQVGTVVPCLRAHECGSAMLLEVQVCFPHALRGKIVCAPCPLYRSSWVSRSTIVMILEIVWAARRTPSAMPWWSDETAKLAAMVDTRHAIRSNAGYWV